MQKTGFDIDKPKMAEPWYGLVSSCSFCGENPACFRRPFPVAELVLMLMHKLVVLVDSVAAWYGCDALVLVHEPEMVCLAFGFSFMIYAIHAPLVVYASKAIFPWRSSNWYGYRMLTFVLLPPVLIPCFVTGAMLRNGCPCLWLP